MSSDTRGSGEALPAISFPEVEASGVELVSAPGHLALAASLYGIEPDPESGVVAQEDVIEAVFGDPMRLITAYGREYKAARTDAMTDLLNKHSWDERFMNLTAEELKAKGTIAVLLIDVDKFKKVNETAGYSEGNRLLIALAGKLRITDEVFRLGGDEYAVLINESDRRGDTKISSEEILDKVETRTVTEARALFAEEFGEHEGLDISIGSVLTGDLGEEVTPQMMFASANKALKAAKAANDAEAQRVAPMRVRIFRAIAIAALKQARIYDPRVMP